MIKHFDLLVDELIKQNPWILTLFKKKKKHKVPDGLTQADIYIRDGPTGADIYDDI